VVEHLLRLQNSNPSVGVAFFYCDGTSPEKRQPRSVVGSLIRQLLTQCPPQHKNIQLTEVRQLYERHHDISGRTARYPPLNIYIALLKRISALFDQIFLVVDGLDEEMKEKIRDKLCNSGGMYVAWLNNF
jgi:hypothetical protein